MNRKSWVIKWRSSLLSGVSTCMLILSFILSALPASSSLAAPSDPGGMSLLGDSEPMGGLGEGSLCVNHTWVDITSYQIKGTIGSTPKQFNTARAKLTFPDNTVKYAFCTDIHHTVGSNEPYCLDSGFYSDWRIAWLVNNYPPHADKEFNAARQAAIWHFSDGFNLDQTDPTTDGSAIDNKVKNHYNDILDAIPLQMPPEYEAGNVSLTITPQNATNFLPGQEAHSFTVTLMKGSKPLVGKTINVSTTFGTLDQTSGVTDDNGQVTFTVRSNTAYSATLTATANVLIPAGSRFIHKTSPTTKQRLVLGEPITTTVQATASKTWVNAQNIIIAHKFEDRNYNGVQDAGEPDLKDWTFTLAVPGGSTFTATTGADGKAYFYDKVSANGTYTLTETLQSNWTNSTPLSQSRTRSESDPWTQWIAHFGNAQYSLITVIKYEDKNENKQMDADEPPLPGWQFYLYQQGEGGNWLQLKGGTTGTDGKLSFSDLKAGTYKVTEFLTDPEYYNTSGMEQVVTLRYPEHRPIYFGNRRFDMDYGDLPKVIQGNPAYNLTLFSDDGARHKPLGEGDVWLGQSRDAEYDGNPESGATGDDGHNTNDEDGVVRGPTWGGGIGKVFVTVNGPSCLMGWVDFAQVNTSKQFTGFGPDFDFTEVISGTVTYNEKVIDNLYLSSTGTHEITFSLPPEFANTAVFARFRLSPYDASKGTTENKCNQNAAGLNGLVIGGEVEDYYWGFGPTVVELKKVSASPQKSAFSVGIIAIAVGTSLAAAGLGRRRRKFSK